MNHFTYEEQLHIKIQYPEWDKHSKIHKNLVGKAFFLKESFSRKECEPAEFLAFMISEVMNDHILSEDLLFFPYLNRT